MRSQYSLTEHAPLQRASAAAQFAFKNTRSSVVRPRMKRKRDR
jgi:hypothetical protein